MQAAAAERDRASIDATLTITKLYYATLIARANAGTAIVVAESRKVANANVVNAANAGTDVRTLALSARAAMLDAEYAVMAADNEAADLESQLGQEVGFPPGTPLLLELPTALDEPLLLMSDYVTQARVSSPDIAAARAAAQQAEKGIAVSRSQWIPDLGVGLTYTYQNGVAIPSESRAQSGDQGLLDRDRLRHTVCPARGAGSRRAARHALSRACAGSDDDRGVASVSPRGARRACCRRGPGGVGVAPRRCHGGPRSDAARNRAGVIPSQRRGGARRF